MKRIIIQGNFTKKNKKPITNKEYISVFDNIVKQLDKNGFEFSGDIDLKEK